MSHIHASPLDPAAGAIAKINARIRTAAGTTDQKLVKISLAISVALVIGAFNRNDTVIDFPAIH